MTSSLVKNEEMNNVELDMDIQKQWEWSCRSYLMIKVK